MNSPVQQQNPTGPGNRQALQNASRRAERQGIPTISAQTLRAAIGSATSRTNFVHLLAEKDIETEFQTRGKAEEIYGYKVKIKGTKEWVSASTLAKDLSWPKIAHRFINDELETEPKSKMPPALKSILLPEQYGTKEIKPHAAHQTEVTLSTEKFNNQVVNLNLGPASTAMLLIAGALAKASLSLVNMVIAFLKRLMAFFGFGMRQSTYQAHEHPDVSAPALCYEPTLLSLPAPKSAEDQVADELFRVAEALEKNDSSLLPVVLGAEKEREAVQAAMAEDDDDDGLSGVATVAEADNFGFSDSDFASSNASLIEPMEALKVALKASEMADFFLEKAGRKNVPLHIDTSDAKEKHYSKVKKALAEAREDFSSWKKSNFFDANNPFSSAKAEREAQIQSLEKHEKEAVTEYESAVARTKKYTQMLKNAPAPIVPDAVKAAAQTARKALLVARQAVHNKAVLMIEVLSRDPKHLAKMGVFEFELAKSLKEFHESEQISVAEMIDLERQFDELKKLKKSQDESGFVPQVPSDFETPEPVLKPDEQVQK